jgi:hypothetical protein
VDVNGGEGLGHRLRWRCQVSIQSVPNDLADPGSRGCNPNGVVADGRRARTQPRWG